MKSLKEFEETWGRFGEKPGSEEFKSNMSRIVKILETISHDIKDTTALVKELKNELQEKLRNEIP